MTQTPAASIFIKSKNICDSKRSAILQNPPGSQIPQQRTKATIAKFIQSRDLMPPSACDVKVSSP